MFGLIESSRGLHAQLYARLCIYTFNERLLERKKQPRPSGSELAIGSQAEKKKKWGSRNKLGLCKIRARPGQRSVKLPDKWHAAMFFSRRTSRK